MELFVSPQIHAQRSVLTFHINYVNYQQYYCLFTDKKKYSFIVDLVYPQVI